MIAVLLDSGFEQKLHERPFDDFEEAKDFTDTVEEITPGRPTAIAKLHFLGPDGEE